jgi:hypothetical protein
MKTHKFAFTLALFMIVSAGLLLVLSCGSGSSSSPSPTVRTGSATVTLSDPPTCKIPIGDFTHVWVTVTRVRAHISSSADGNDGGWVDLADLTANPMQIDLLNIGANTCALATLGSVSGLPPGNYQQIRLHLLSNNPAAGVAVPAVNNCGSNGYNCVMLPGPVDPEVDPEIHTLLLSSQDQTGIKIPPGHIAGGGISIEAGQTANINIDFSACASVIRQGNGKYRLKPTLHAGGVSASTDSISGRVIDNVSGQPIPGATIFVFAEQPDANDATVDRVIMSRTADSTAGTFSFCPLPSGNYDIVVAAVSDAGVAYNATVTFGVPTGTAMPDIPLQPETDTDTSAAQIQGHVSTTVDGTTATGADIAMSAFQQATPSGGSAMNVTIPLLPTSDATFATDALPACDVGTKCYDYTLSVPGSNPMVGTFDTAGTVYAPPAVGDIPYSLGAQAFVPGGEGTADCSPSTSTTNFLSDGVTPLAVTVGTPVTAQTLAFTGCTTGF